MAGLADRGQPHPLGGPARIRTGTVPPLRLPQRQGRSPARRPAASQAPCGPPRSTPLFTIPSASRAGDPAGRCAAQRAGLGRRPARRRAADLARDYTPRPARPPLFAPPTLRAPLPRPRRGEPLRGTLRGVAGVATRRFTRVCYTDPFSFWGPLGVVSAASRGQLRSPALKPRRNRSPRLCHTSWPARSHYRHRACRPLPQAARRAWRRPRRGALGGALRSRGGRPQGKGG